MRCDSRMAVYRRHLGTAHRSTRRETQTLLTADPMLLDHLSAVWDQLVRETSFSVRSARPHRDSDPPVRESKSTVQRVNRHLPSYLSQPLRVRPEVTLPQMAEGLIRRVGPNQSSDQSSGSPALRSPSANTERCSGWLIGSQSLMLEMRSVGSSSCS